MAWGNWAIRAFDSNGKIIENTFGFGTIFSDEKRKIKVIIYKDYVTIEDPTTFVPEPESFSHPVVMMIKGTGRVEYRGICISTKMYLGRIFVIVHSQNGRIVNKNYQGPYFMGFGTYKNCKKNKEYLPKDTYEKLTKFVTEILDKEIVFEESEKIC
jgi:hypothetical protein